MGELCAKQEARGESELVADAAVNEAGSLLHNPCAKFCPSFSTPIERLWCVG